MKMFARAVVGIIAFFAADISVAVATPINLTFNGQFGAYSVYDGSQQFGANTYGSIATPTNYTITLTYDPSLLTGNSCPTASVNTSCQWNFGASGITEAVTINGITKTFAGTSGNIQYCTNCGGDLIQINANTANGGYFGGQFLDTTAFFANQLNANNPNLLIAFNNVSLKNGNYGSSTSTGGALSFNTSPTNLSSSVGATAAVPEPITLSLFGAGLLGAGALRRRKNKKTAAV